MMLSGQKNRLLISQQAAILPISAEENKHQLAHGQAMCLSKHLEQLLFYWLFSEKRVDLMQDILLQIEEKVFKPEVISFPAWLIVEHHHCNPFHLIQIDTF
jgi:hypothetical protein